MSFRIPRYLCIPVLVLCAALPLLAQPESRLDSPAAEAKKNPAQTYPANTGPVKTLVIDDLGKGLAPLDGPWQFHLGDDPSWAQPNIDDSQWEQLLTGQPWGAQGHANYAGYAWYRRHISLTAALDSPPDFALLFSLVEDSYQIYWNGVLVGRNGVLPPHPVWYHFQPPQTFGLGPVRSGVLAIRVWKSPLQSFDNGIQGGIDAVPLIGSPAAIASAKDGIDYQWLRRRQFTFGLDSLYCLVAVLGFLAWFRDRRQWLFFWMAIFTLTPLVNLFLLSIYTGMSNAWALGLAQPNFGLTDISIWFVLIYLLQLDKDETLMKFFRLAALLDIVATCLDGTLSVLDWPSHRVLQVQIADAILTAIFTLLEFLPLVLVAVAFKRRQRLDHARWLVAFFATTTEMISVVRIASQQGSRFTHWTLGKRITTPLFEINGNPFNVGLISAVLLLVSVVYAVYRYMSENSRRQAQLEQEFRSARELQQVLVPETLPTLPGFAVTSAYRPAQEVGGDFFQIIPLDSEATLVILGDVSGKGLKAAMAVSMIVGATRMIADYSTDPGEILTALNRRLYGRMQGGFATCLAMRLNADGSCVVASAGHPAPYLNDRELTLPGALPLGLSPIAEYEEIVVRLVAGDHCSLYTDGLLEARNGEGELYGFGRLGTLFAGKPDATQVTEAAIDFGQDDDITVLTLTRLSTGQECTAVHDISSFAHV